MTTETETTATTGAAPAPTDPLARVILELLAEAGAADRRRAAADEALKAHLSPQAMAAYRELVDAIDDERGAWIDVHVAELARHLPGMAPAVRLLWAHVIDERVDAVGTCCADGGPIEP